MNAAELIESLAALRSSALDDARAATTPEALNAVRVRVLGRKGDLTSVLRGLKDLAPEDRTRVGQEANRLKDDLEAFLAERQGALEDAAEQGARGLDVTLPGRRPWVGGRHVLTALEAELVDVFHGLGFTAGEGPEVEDDFHNFTALNLPPGHPAREAHDTYYVSDDHRAAHAHLAVLGPRDGAGEAAAAHGLPRARVPRRGDRRVPLRPVPPDRRALRRGRSAGDAGRPQEHARPRRRGASSARR